MLNRLPLMLAITAWLSPISFAIWASIELRFHSQTAGVPFELLFAWFGAIVGLSSAGAALYLLWIGKKSARPVHSPRLSCMLALAFLVLTGLGTALLLPFLRSN